MAVENILPGAVDQIYVNRFGVETMMVPVFFNSFNKGHSFIEVVPGEVLQVSEAVFDTNGQFGAELTVGFSFAPHDKATMGLANADYMVLHAVSFVVKHVLLLAVKFYDCFQNLAMVNSKGALSILALQPLDMF